MSAASDGRATSVGTWPRSANRSTQRMPEADSCRPVVTVPRPAESSLGHAGRTVAQAAGHLGLEGAAAVTGEGAGGQSEQVVGRVGAVGVIHDTPSKREGRPSSHATPVTRKANRRVHYHPPDA